jgi:hypothetical protein
MQGQPEDGTASTPVRALSASEMKAAHFPKLLRFLVVLCSRGFVEAFGRETKV